MYLLRYYTAVLLCCILNSATNAQVIDLQPSTHRVAFKDGKRIELTNSTSAFSQIPKNNSPISLSEMHPITVRSDFVMEYLWIYNETALAGDTIVYPADSQATVWRPAGRYTIFAGYPVGAQEQHLITRANVELTKARSIHLSQIEARDYSIEFDLLREDGNALRISLMTLSFYGKFKNSNFQLFHYNSGHQKMRLRTNYFPEHFDREWAVKGKQLFNVGNLYLVSGSLQNGQGDTIVRNIPKNLAAADFYYHFPDSIERHRRFQIFTFFPNSHLSGGGDIIYTHPFHLKVFQDTSIQLSARSSIFFQILNTDSILHGQIYTPQRRINDSGVTGYFLFDPGRKSFPISLQTEEVHLGLPPVYWFGKFYNAPDTVKIRSPYGFFQYLFLSQSNDVLKQYDIEYVIFRQDSIVKQGNLPPAIAQPDMVLGFDQDSLTIPMSPDAYKIEVTNHHHELAGRAGISQVTASFDLRAADRNPPNMILFQMLSNRRLVDIIDPAQPAEVRFILEEYEGNIDSVVLYYAPSEDSIWTELALVFNDPYWQGEIPSLSDGFYSWRLSAVDDAGNSIECLMSPGFLVDQPTAIQSSAGQSFSGNPDLIYLEGNYPNPFNSTTIIRYSLSVNRLITLKIYDILGRRVRTLVEERQPAGRYTVSWNGRDDAGQPLGSGIYFYRLKSGNRQLTRRMLLMK